MIGILAAGFVHQFGSSGLFNNCRVISPLTPSLVGVGGLILCGASGFASWHGARFDSGARRLIGVVSVGASALFALAIVLPIIAAWLIPICFQ